jgi:hypothetical protein
MCIDCNQWLLSRYLNSGCSTAGPQVPGSAKFMVAIRKSSVNKFTRRKRSKGACHLVRFLFSFSFMFNVVTTQNIEGLYVNVYRQATLIGFAEKADYIIMLKGWICLGRIILSGPHTTPSSGTLLYCFLLSATNNSRHSYLDSTQFRL